MKNMDKLDAEIRSRCEVSGFTAKPQRTLSKRRENLDYEVKDAANSEVSEKLDYF